ncbi:hypothetical protein I2F17_12245 [Acinetobacter sp. B10A]|uniref:zonular occludens toxin domain-containing protein n=1 Tax=Acinetobacter baretiae TaxID=2605383 RepID=UPI001B3C6824|nr:zonular occludens toxin domain-containing protein [Acinetobacter baretiae]MBF7686588.1 hypothetical protein [Acinetobacter baretiae]
MSEAVGGIFRLICGGIGTGKSYFCVREAELEKKKGKYKNIYSNIRAHAELAEGVQSLPDDWRDCEPDSLVIIDEIQLHQTLGKNTSSRKDSAVADLSMIRHDHLDLWIISPNPALVKSDVRQLVNQYYWLEIESKTVSKGWVFTKVHNSVTKNIKNTAHEEFTYKIEEKYWKLYKTTKDGRASGRSVLINWKLIGFVIGILIVLLVIYLLSRYLFSSTNDSVTEMKKVEQQNNDKQALIKSPFDKSTVAITPENIDFECRKGENISKPECRKWLDDLTSGHKSLKTINYDPSKPYELEEAQKDVEYQVINTPKFSGCISAKGKYQAYTEQGTYLNVDKSVCDRLIANAGDRPYDYFSDRKTRVETSARSSQSDQDLTTASKEMSAKNVVVLGNTPTFVD